jgi:hypothetical protein
LERALHFFPAPDESRSDNHAARFRAEPMGVHMRRPWSAAVLFTGALLLGTFLGASTNLSHVAIKSAVASEQEGSKSKLKDKDPPATPGKGAAGTHCKVTKDCQPSLVCTQAGDHKECTSPPVKVPEAPVMT